jgi:hypothetical protein
MPRPPPSRPLSLCAKNQAAAPYIVASGLPFLTSGQCSYASFHRHSAILELAEHTGLILVSPDYYSPAFFLSMPPTCTSGQWLMRGREPARPMTIFDPANVGFLMRPLTQRSECVHRVAFIQKVLICNSRKLSNLVTIKDRGGPTGQ